MNRIFIVKKNKKNIQEEAVLEDYKLEKATKTSDKTERHNFQTLYTEVLERGNSEEIEEFKKRWGLGHYGVDAIREKLKKDGVDVDSPVYDDGIVRISKASMKANAEFIVNGGHISRNKERNK